MTPTDITDTAPGDALITTDAATRPFDEANWAGTSRLGPGSIVGRYLLLHRLGAGAQGEVFAAHDPSLGRRVALKVLLSPEAEADGAEGRGHRRLLREAQALARLSHPNVVAVHDVGVHDGSVYLAMEHVDGVTLRLWVDTQPQRWQRVVDAVLAVGDGVVAAHAAGLLHRDIKPDNVMLGRDGGIRLMDFGLVRATQDGEDHGSDGDTSADPPRVRAFTGQLTEDRAIAGTPAYMAPEQWRGAEAGPAADQFALCVTAWELLHGERPFAGKGLVELRRNVLTGALADAPAGARVPRWLRQTLSVGLATEPDARHRSVATLLAALRRGMARERRRSYERVGIGGLILASAALGYHAWDARQTRQHCDAQADELAATWNDERRSSLDQAVRTSGLSYASDTAARLLPRVDAYAEQWRRARSTLCMRTASEPSSTEDLDERGTWCLEERAASLSVLVSSFIEAPAVALPEMITSVGLLPSPESCLDPARLASMTVPEVADRPRVRSVHANLTRAEFLGEIASHDEAHALAEAALVEARELGWPPLTALALHRTGVLLEMRGRYADAEAALEDAFFEAMSGDASAETAFDAAVSLALVGARLARIEDGRRWARVADALASERPADPLRTTGLTQVLGILDRDAGDLASAWARTAAVVAIRTEVLGQHHPNVGRALSNLASARSAMGAYDEAAHLYERAMEIERAALGPDHPAVGELLHNLARVRYNTGRYDDARALAERALVILTAARGSDHPSVESTLGVLGGAQLAAGDEGAAAATMRRALAIAESRSGDAHPAIAAALGNLALVEHQRGRYADAIELQRRALTIELASRGADHPDVATTRFNLGRSHLAAGEFDAAQQQFELALASLEAASGKDSARLIEPLVGLAETALARGVPADALALAERACSIAMLAASNGVGRVESLEWARFVSAQALWSAAGDDVRGAWDRARAVMVADSVRASMIGRGGAATGLTEIETWLDRHTKPPDPGGPDSTEEPSP